jgi:hypothetical protein
MNLSTKRHFKYLLVCTLIVCAEPQSNGLPLLYTYNVNLSPIQINNVLTASPTATVTTVTTATNTNDISNHSNINSLLSELQKMREPDHKPTSGFKAWLWDHKYAIALLVIVIFLSGSGVYSMHGMLQKQYSM